MPVRRLVPTALVGVALALTLAGPIWAQPGPCDGAHALLDARLYDAAIAAYTDLLKPQPSSNLTPTGQGPTAQAAFAAQYACASAGIKEAADKKAADLARQSVQKGKAFADAGQLTQARDAYVQALVLVPDQPEATAGLSGITIAQQMDAVRELKKQGLRGGASDRLHETLASHPEISVPDDLRDLLKADEPSWIWGADQWVQYLKRPIEVAQSLGSSVLVPVAAFCVLVVFTILKVWPSVTSFLEVRVDIQEFNDEAVDVKIGKAVSQLIEDSLRGFDDPGNSRRPGMVTGSLQPFTPPTDVTSASSQVRWISAVIQWLFPPNVVVVSGWLLAPSDHGAGLTLQLSASKNGKILTSQTLWQHEYDPWPPEPAPTSPSPYYSLAEPAAAWLAFHLDVYQRRRRIE